MKIVVVEENTYMCESCGATYPNETQALYCEKRHRLLDRQAKCLHTWEYSCDLTADECFGDPCGFLEISRDCTKCNVHERIETNEIELDQDTLEKLFKENQ